MKIEEAKVGLDGWDDWVSPERGKTRIICCDCGLAHDHQFRVRKGKIEWRSRRNERSTAQVRRHMKKK